MEGLVFGRELEDDLVGTSLGNTKLRSNEYHTENEEWKEVVVSGLIKKSNSCTICSSVTSVPAKLLESVVHWIDCYTIIITDMDPKV